MLSKTGIHVLSLSNSFPETSKTETIEYRADIDGLRAIAVIAVVLFHAFPKIFPGGFIGVDLFFVISGFLISALIAKQMSNDTFSFTGFYARRIRRIFPSLALTFLMVITLGWIVLVSPELEQLGRELVAGSFFFSNFYYYSQTGYFDSDDKIKFLLNLWSLSVEEHFYIFWPAFLFVVFKSRTSPLWIVLLLLSSSLAFCIWLTRSNPDLAFYLSFSRFWELLAGAMLALSAKYGRPGVQLSKNIKSLASLLGISAICSSCLIFRSSDGFPGWQAILPVAAATAIISGGADSWANRNLLSQRPIVYLGLISYPIYLFHWPLLMFAKTIAVKSPTTATKLLIIAITIVLAALAFHLVERPLRRSGKLNLKALGLISTMAVSGIVGFALIANKGFPNRSAAEFNDEVAAYARSQQKPDKSKTKCVVEASVPIECRSDVPIDQADVAIVGDSHAGALYPGLNKTLSRSDRHVVWFGGNSCPFLLDLERDQKCGDGAQNILQTFAAHPAIKTVILVNRWALYETNDFFGDAEVSLKRVPIGSFSRPNLQDAHTILSLSLERTIVELGRLKKRVILVSDVPELGVHPSRCFKRPFREKAATCQVAREVFLKRSQSSRELLAGMTTKFDFVSFFDPQQLFCDDFECSAKKSEEFLYQDDDHISLFGADMVSQKLVETLPWLKETTPAQ